MRSAVELAKDWRSDKILHKLEALLLVADSQRILMISGNGEVIEPDDGITAIGSGGMYALASARALMGAERAGWLGAAWRLTGKPLLGALLCAVALGARSRRSMPSSPA